MTALRHIPLPLRIVALIIVAALVYKVGRNFGGLMTIMAVLLWTLALAALLYDHGSLNALSRVPVASHVLRFLIARPAHAAGRTDGPGSRELTEAERRKLYIDGIAEIDALVGLDGTVEEIHHDLIDVTRASADVPGHRLGVNSSGLLVLLHGPRGVGKSGTARALAKIHTGLGALRTAKMIVVGERDADKARQSLALDDLATAKTMEAVGGTLLLDDADWLLAEDPGGGMKPGVAFGQAVLEVLSEHPRETLVIMTLTDGGERRLRGDPEHARWLGKLSVRSIAFNDLDEDALYEILSRTLERDRIRIDPDAERPVRGLLRDEMRRFGSEHADNASAALRGAALLSDAACRRDPAALCSGSVIITRDDVRMAADGQ